MLWNELTEPEQDFYRWFHGQQCGICDNNQCPVVQAQNEDTGRETPLFYPEAIYGEPRKLKGRKNVFFLAINPNYGGGAEGEMATCYNVERNPNVAVADYAERYLNWFVQPNQPKHDDSITRAALWLLLRMDGAEPEGTRPLLKWNSEPFAQAVERSLLAGLVELNMVHCKCRMYANRFGLNDPLPADLPFEQRCDAMSFKALDIWKPRAVVVMGGPQWPWLDRMVQARGGSPWRIDGEERHLEHAPQYGASTTLHWNDDGHHTTELIAAYHPSNRLYDHAHATAIADILHQALLG